MKPAAYIVTEQSFPGIVSTSSPIHHLDLRDVAPKLSYQLYNQTALSSPSAAGNLRSTGHVRFFDGRLQDDNAVGSGGDLTGTAHRIPPELCDPVSSQVTAPSSTLYRKDTTSFPVRCCSLVCIGDSNTILLPTSKSAFPTLHRNKRDRIESLTREQNGINSRSITVVRFLT